MTRQSLTDTVAGDLGTDSPLETEVCARVTSSPSPSFIAKDDQGASSSVQTDFDERTTITPPVHRVFLSGRLVEAELREIDQVQVGHAHEGLASISEVGVLEGFSTGVEGPCEALFNHGRTRLCRRLT